MDFSSVENLTEDEVMNQYLQIIDSERIGLTPTNATYKAKCGGTCNPACRYAGQNITCSHWETEPNCYYDCSSILKRERCICR